MYHSTTAVLLLYYYGMVLLLYYGTTVLLLHYYCTIACTTTVLHTTAPYQASDVVDCGGNVGWRQKFLENDGFLVLVVILE